MLIEEWMNDVSTPPGARADGLNNYIVGLLISYTYSKLGSRNDELLKAWEPLSCEDENWGYPLFVKEAA